MYMFPAEVEQDNDLLLVSAFRLSTRVLPKGLHSPYGFHCVVVWVADFAL